MRNKAVRVLCGLLLAGLFFACAQEPEALSSGKTQKGGPKVEAALPDTRPGPVAVIHLAGGDYGYPSPYAHYPRGPGGYKMCLIFDSLLERSDKGLIPWLATEWQVIDQGKAYIFTLRKGVKWQDGAPLTPEDVAFSLDYAARHPMIWSYVFDLIDTVTVLPGHQIKVTLKHPTATMLGKLGRTRILPKHIWETVENPTALTGPKAVIGSGPYRLTAYSREHGTYRFEASDRFWGPKPLVKRIEFVPVSEPILAYEKGEIDLLRVSPDLLPRFAHDPAHRVTKSPAFWGYRLLFDTGHPGPLQDKRVRQAFAYAIDRDELVAKIARGAALPGRAEILPPDHTMAAAPIKSYDFNPEMAKNRLDQAGYPLPPGQKIRVDRDDHPLAFDLLCSGQEVRMAEILKQRLAAVGVSMEILAVDGKTRDSRVRDHRFQLALIGHGGWGGDPDYLTAHCTQTVAHSNSPSASGAGLNMPALASRLESQRLETDPAKRRHLIEEIQHLAAEAVPEIPLFYTTAYTVFRPDRYAGWMFMFDHHSLEHSKLSYLDWKGWH